MIDLWTVYFEVMQEYLDGLLDILVACICQGKSIRVDEVEDRREIDLLFGREGWLTNRKRYSCSNRYFMFPTTPRVQCPKTLPGQMGEYRIRLRPVVHNYNCISVV